MPASRAPVGFPRMSLLAGWLFADLFLVLFVLSLASRPAKPPVPRVTTSPPAPPPRVLFIDSLRATDWA